MQICALLGPYMVIRSIDDKYYVYRQVERYEISQDLATHSKLKNSFASLAEAELNMKLLYQNDTANSAPTSANPTKEI
jgi:hypothetical protein